MSFVALLVSDNSGSLEKLELGQQLSQPPQGNILLRVQVFVVVCGYLCVRFDLLSSVNLRDISGCPKLGAHYLY